MKELELDGKVIEGVVGKVMKGKEELKGGELGKVVGLIVKEDLNLE